jgi:D-proline reductase (dithiol) PrdB
VGLIQRVIEDAGIVTISITLSEEITRKVRPPRALWPGFPLGHPLGHPDQADCQLHVLRAMLNLLEELESPGALVKRTVTGESMNVTSCLPRFNTERSNSQNINP